VTGFSLPTRLRAVARAARGDDLGLSPVSSRHKSEIITRLGCGAVLAAMLAATGCTTVVAGHARPAPIPVSALCPHEGGSAASAASCLSDDLRRMWTRWTGKEVSTAVVVDPSPGAVHRDCAAFLAFGTAFYCPPDGHTYITGTAVKRDRREFGDGLPYALAVIVAHEYGHRLQHVVGTKGMDGSGDAASRRIEQQADCLAGVWAHDAAIRGRLNPAAFRDVERRELTLISRLKSPPGSRLGGYDETRTHGTVAQRVAAFDRGYGGGPPACGVNLPARRTR
jgi:predicted metalloprotease